MVKELVGEKSWFGVPEALFAGMYLNTAIRCTTALWPNPQTQPQGGHLVLWDRPETSLDVVLNEKRAEYVFHLHLSSSKTPLGFEGMTMKDLNHWTAVKRTRVTQVPVALPKWLRHELKCTTEEQRNYDVCTNHRFLMLLCVHLSCLAGRFAVAGGGRRESAMVRGNFH